MPNYTFQRPDGTYLSKRLSFAEYDSLVKGEVKLVDVDDQELVLIFNPGDLKFVLKDGESGGWASKSMKENKYRQERRQVMTKRERDHAPKTRLIPNFGGREAHSWADVQDHARTVNGVASAATYDRLVKLESAS
jgi:hypothetical protein